MRIIKRIFPLLAAAMLMLAMGQVAWAAESRGQITVSDAAGAPGDTVSVMLNMAKNPGIIAAVLQVSYDDSVLKLVSVQDGKLLDDGLFSESLDRNPYLLSWNNALATSNVTATGVLATFSFKILDGAKAGDSAITVTYNQANLFDWQLVDVPFDTTPGKVTVTAKSTASGGGGGGATSTGSTKVDTATDTKSDDTAGKTDSTQTGLYGKYTDLAANGWYRSGVEYMLSNGYMNGVSADTFDLEGAVTRAQFVTILYRYAGSPDVAGLNNPFADVAADAWYAKAVEWGVNNGVVKGVSDTAFDPEAPLTREQLATQLYRYDKAQAPSENHLQAYADVAKISDYAKDAMNWAVGKQIMNGVSETELAPQSTATRGQTAVLLSRYFMGLAQVPTTPVADK